MPILSILTSENTILRKEAQEIENVLDVKIKRLTKDMIKTMKKNNGIGLAAPQVGKSIRLIIIDTKEGPLILANPKISKFSRGREGSEEGCLSVPGVYGVVKRAKKIKFEGILPNGQKIKERAEGLLARVIQHEIDHLDGILFTDKIARETTRDGLM
jgi:peptide deformylase